MKTYPPTGRKKKIIELSPETEKQLRLMAVSEGYNLKSHIEHILEDMVKDVDKLPGYTRRTIKKILNQVRDVQNLHEIANCSKLQGVKAYYRIRNGDYRMTLTYDGSAVIMRRALSRWEINKK